VPWPLYLTPFVMSAVLTAATGGFAWSLRARVSTARAFAGVQLFECAWTLLYIGELLAPSVRGKLALDRLQDVAMVLATVSSIAFALRYTGRTPRRAVVVWAALAAVPAPFIAWALGTAVAGPLDPSIRIDPVPPFGSLEFDLSGLDGVILGVAFVYVSVAFALLIDAIGRQHRVHRVQTLLLAFGLALPTAGGTLGLASGVRYLGQRDVTPALFGIAAALVAWALFSRRVLDLVPVARHFIVENLPDGVIVLDGQGRVAEANHAAARFLVVSPEEAIGRPAAEVVARWADIARAIAGPLGPEGARISVGGSVFDVRTSVVGPSDRPAGHAIVLRDITPVHRANVELREAREDLERQVADRTKDLFETNEWLQQEVTERAAAIADLQRAERERRALVDRLERTHRVEAIGRFAGGIGHDFNNLLTTILANAKLARGEVPEGGELASMLDDLVHAAEEAGRFTKQLLALSGRQPVRPERVALGPAIEAIRPLVLPVLGGRIAFRPHVGETSPIWIDPRQLEQIVAGLAARARDVLRDGGTFELEARDATLAPGEARDRGVAPGRWVILTLRDDGEALSEDAQRDLLEPFHAPASGVHRGIGLVTVHGAVARSGGFVEVRSGPGRGTAFDVWLPSAERHPAAPAVEARAEAGKGERLMLVEDQEPVRLATARVLGRLGYRVRAFESGADALAAMANGEPVDLLVTDVQMPDMSGPALATSARGRRPDLRVLYVSGLVEDGDPDVRRAREDACWLSKPFTPAALADAVQRALRGHPAAPGGESARPAG
jgi:PAS domain S-box-containing protein